MYCSHCGTHLANSSAICYNCGQKVDPDECLNRPLPKVKPLVDLDRGASHKKEQPAERKPVSKKPFIICAAVAAALVAVAVAATAISDAFFGPEAFVAEYFNAIANGDSAKASSMTASDPDAHNEQEAGVIAVLEGALADPADRISDVQVGEVGEDGAVSVSYTIDGNAFTSVVAVKDRTPQLPFLKEYVITESAEVAFPLSNSGPCRLLLNGAEFQLPSFANKRYPVQLMCLPGRYTLSAPASDVCTCDQMDFVVAGAIETAAQDGGKGYSLDIRFADSLAKAAQDSVAAYLESCVAQGMEDPEGAPFKAHLTSNSEFAGWTGISAMPQIKALEGVARNAASMQMIQGASVLYATTSGGSVEYGYTYEFPPSKRHERTASARMRAMDIYVNLQSGAISIACDGKTVYGDVLDAVLTGENGWEEMLSEFDLPEALESMRAGL